MVTRRLKMPAGRTVAKLVVSPMPRVFLYSTLTLMYAERDGGPVVKGAPQAWKKINGLMFSTWGYVVLICFRRCT